MEFLVLHTGQCKGQSFVRSQLVQSPLCPLTTESERAELPLCTSMAKHPTQGCGTQGVVPEDTQCSLEQLC